MNIKSMRIKSHRSFAVDEAPLPPPRLRTQGRPGGAGHAPQIPVHEQGANPRHAGAQGLPPERLHHRADHRARLRARRDPRASLCEGRLKPRRRRSFNNWARRWRYGAKAGSPGELVRIDHMTHTRDGKALKSPEFRAIRPVTKFMAEFEDACAKLGVQLHVPPPRRPQRNGCVERANRSVRIEFRSRYGGPLTIAGAAKALAKYEFLHNYVRPHASLEYQTPNEYLVAMEAA